MDTLIKNTWLTSQTQKVKKIYKSLSPERVLTLWVFSLLSILFIFSALVVFNKRFLTTVPTYGGSFSEGIIGTPRFINPVLATTDQDRDLTSLVYAGLTKKDVYGESVLDMASSIVKSEDGLQYDVSIKPTARFQDGTPVTADDVIYTVSLIQNPIIKSPHYIEWEGVSMEKTNNTSLTISLKKPYPYFMDILSIGILPKHIWKNLSDDQISLSDLNINAVGSGPYAIKSIKTKSGIPISIQLEAHKNYTLGRPYVENITIETYPNEKSLIQAFDDGVITRMHGISPEKLSTLKVATSSIESTLLPRTFTVFFNPNKVNTLSEKEVRQALSMAIDKETIVKTVLRNYGKVINEPYPFDTTTSTSTYNLAEAKELLAKSKSLKKASSTLELTLATANTDEMKQVAEMIKNDWEALGVKTTLSIYDISDLNQSVIKDRDFEVLLFGSITENPSDLYAFWHSSQRIYPGLNISNYVSKELDANLETLRTSDDELSRISAYDAVKKEFEDETPGIFLFAPSLIYITKDKVHTILPNNSFDSSSRFTLVSGWYRYTEKVWLKTYYKDMVQKLENFIH